MEFQGAMTGSTAGLGNRLSAQVDAGSDRSKIARESGVLSEAERLGRAVSEHEQVLTQLLARIEPIIRNEPSSVGNGGASAPDAMLCQVGDAIRCERRRLEAMSSILRDVVKRIDL